MTLVEQLESWIKDEENERLEFKKAENTYDFEKLIKYCVALANEGGGKVILGVTDKKPRQILGTRAFLDLEKKKTELTALLHLRVEAFVIPHPQGRVVVFDIPSRPLGVPLNYQGSYLMRSGESLIAMTQDQLKRIFDEGIPDFSATICDKAVFSDLHPGAIAEFRKMWIQKSGNQELVKLSEQQLLEDAELIVDGHLTHAALILFGTRQALGKHLAQAEVIFEYRSSESSIEYQARIEFREGFFLYKDKIWELINLRNEVQQISQGLFRRDIRAFNEKVSREAILNAVSHRDYQSPGSVFVKQFSRQLVIASPGGFPTGITEQNIIRKQQARNRRIAEAFAKCGLVERSGQGADTMFRESLREGKAKPSFQGTDDHEVVLTLHGELQHPEFVTFVEQISQENNFNFATDDFITLDAVYREEQLSEEMMARVSVLAENGLIEKVGRGRGVKYVLSRRFYSFLEQKGVYTRKRGLDRETHKALLLKHIQDNQQEGSQLSELSQVLPMLSRDQLQSLLKELKREAKVKLIGVTKSARWYPAKTQLKRN
jgi:ATP-dependent DNA helicase RecG